MPEFTLMQKIIIGAIPVLFAITVHEVSHGWIASKLGDPTAKMLGRLTLNPIKHIDPIGTLLVPILLFYFTGYVFGWAKPVPIGWRNLKNPRRDMALVAIAGPLANLGMVFLWALFAKIILILNTGVESPSLSIILMVYMCHVGIIINIVLMLLNLIPIPPLDGSRVLSGLVPKSIALWLDRIEPYGLIILVILLLSRVLFTILYPLIFGSYQLIMALFNL